MKNIGSLMKQAKQMQAKMAEVQEGLANLTVEASSGGGKVSVVVTGKQEIVEIRIDPEVVDPDDVEMLQDLVTAAVNEALRKAGDVAKDEMDRTFNMGLGLVAIVSASAVDEAIGAVEAAGCTVHDIGRIESLPDPAAVATVVYA